MSYSPFDLNDPYGCYLHALCFLKAPFLAGESIIAKDAEFSYKYAYWVLDKKPFPAGEPAIAKDFDYSYRYASEVLKDPDPKTWRKRFIRIRGGYDPWEALREA